MSKLVQVTSQPGLKIIFILLDYPTGASRTELSFEIVRPIGSLERMVRAVTLIPGTTEFGYDRRVIENWLSMLNTKMIK